MLTEWHIRYRGPGIMVYWHVEKKSLCIYSQIKRCSSSEVAAMIEGVLRHATDMNVEKDYVDSHGQDEAAFAFCYMLDLSFFPGSRELADKNCTAQKQAIHMPTRICNLFSPFPSIGS